MSSSLESYRDVGALTIYAGCAATEVSEVIDLVVAELRDLKARSIPAEELQRAKDISKANLVFGLESTASRMSQLARSELYFGRQIDLSEDLACLDSVNADDVQRVAADLFSEGDLAVTVLGPKGGPSPSVEQLDLGC